MPSQEVIEKLENLQAELFNISIAVKHVEDAATVAKTASEILKHIPGLLNDIKAIEEKHRNELLKDHKGKIAVLENQLQNLLAELKEKSKLLNQLIVETKKLENTISDYYSEIKKINFPERLDKIDNQISSINIGVANLQTAIQNTQTKVDSVQTSLSSTSQAIEKRFFDLENKIVSENSSIKKEIKTNRIIMICFGVIVIIGIGLMLILHYN